MGARDDVGEGIRDGAQDGDAAGDRLPRSPDRFRGPARPMSPEATGDAPTGTPDPADLPVPDLLELDLAELRTVRHPVLTEVLADLRARSGEPSEILWGFNNAF
ncbi:FxSxx-COOH cyclophane-containing RiPP peptide [Streptomyces sp. NPDC059371]|uniref:FxSxx-COOH cyclophane-containing RiPP peptide n=1 Tax=Streptomyces sp. NPDC059371 TaxID=3346812 RepID=UPI0036BE939F